MILDMELYYSNNTSNTPPAAAMFTSHSLTFGGAWFISINTDQAIKD
jgi:hypothetical protein